MKKLLLMAVVGLILTSCSFESYQCHTYGTHNQVTKHGQKAQAKYYKKRI